MKWFTPSLILVLAAVAGLSAQAFDSVDWLARRELATRAADELRATYAKTKAASTEPAEQITVPLEAFPNGAIKAQLFAKKAQIFLSTGWIWAEGIVATEFNPDRTVKSTLEADEAVVNRLSHLAWSEGWTKASYNGEVEMEGTGVYADPTAEFITVYKDARLHTLAKSRYAGYTVRATRADYDRKAGVIMLEGDVQVDAKHKDDPIHLDGHLAYVFLEGTNSFKRVVAFDGVKVQSGTRGGSADHAVYYRAANKLILYGGPAGRAHLEERGRNTSSIDGDRITFWVDSEQVEVENSEITVDTKDIKKNGGFNRK